MRIRLVARALLLSLVLGFLSTPKVAADGLVYDTWVQGSSGGYHLTISQYNNSFLVGADLHELSTGNIYVPTFRAWLPSEMMAFYLTPGNMWTRQPAKLRFCWRGDGNYGTGSAYDYSMFFAWAQTMPNGDWVNLVGYEDHLPQYVTRFTDGNCAAVLLQ